MPSFSHHYYTTYSIKSLSLANLYCLLSLCLTLLLPVFFLWGGQNLWKHQNYQQFEVRYNYTGLYSVQVNYNDYNDGANKILQQSNIINNPYTTTNDIALSISDLPHSLSGQISIPLGNTITIQSLNILLFYTVEIPALQKTASSVVSISVNDNILYSSIRGEMEFSPSQVISGLKSTVQLNAPLYYPNYQVPQTHAQIRDSLLTDDIYPITLSKTLQNVRGSADPRTISIKLAKQTKMLLPYYPSILQTLKFSFSKILAFMIIVYFVLRRLLLIFIKEGFFYSTASDDIVA